MQNFKPYPVQQVPGVDATTQPGMNTPQPIASIMSNIHEAVASRPEEDIEKIIRDNPACVNERGFNGQVPLHKAAMRGASDGVKVLLRFKADPNMRNNFEETPFHYSCRRGNPAIMHVLKEAGADIHAVDRAGRAAMHHAAQGGNVLAMKYLLEVCNLSPNAVDNNGATPLHLISQHGHTEALKFLLSKERGDFLAKDYQGNTPLHTAAQAGFGWTCWMFISQCGLHLLHDANRDGHLPLDLAKRGKEFKFKDIVNLLAFHSKLPFMKGEKAEGPRLAWYFHLFLPLIAYPLLIGFSQMFTKKGFPALIGLLLLVGNLYRHSHRMEHISRWGNPIFMGTFATGLFYTMACYYLEIMQYLYEDFFLLVCLSIVCTLIMLNMYRILLTGDPGIIRETCKKDNGEDFTILDVATEAIRFQALCPECELVPPHRTRHCKLCEKCYYDCDHHCLFLYRCVARYNHRLFVLFITLVILCMIMFEYICVQYIQIHYPDAEFNKAFLWDFFNNFPCVWTTMLCNGVSLIWGITLLKFQLNVISKGMTTAYQPNLGKTSLNRTQRFRNIVNFMAGYPPFAVESVPKKI